MKDKVFRRTEMTKILEGDKNLFDEIFCSAKVLVTLFCPIK